MVAESSFVNSKIEFLNSKEKKQIRKQLEEEQIVIPKSQFFIRKHDKIYVINEEVRDLPLLELKVYSLGIHIATQKGNLLEITPQAHYLFAAKRGKEYL